ncbi:Aldehyde dehydrogenase [Cladobotryum mycophilum]|uniref:Aldehyde dehydrogenase n=1 Tax=Cladobotryum mycophilum TaxID=491253 RepID=A0ABR0SLI5_9HYPO
MSNLVAQLKAPNGVEFSLPTGLFINNEFVEATSGSKITSISPINGEEIVSVEAASEADIDRAVQAARAAFQEDSEWRSLTGTERAALMHKLADLIEEHKHTLATIETWDNGKPYLVARDEDLNEVTGTLRYYAGYADKIHGQTIPTHANKLAYTLRQPIGVCAQIIPWNYPLGMAAWKLGPALATGNTIVLKPAEQTPLSILYVADLIRQAGFPRAEAGKALTVHPQIRKIAFTGSTATGREIMKAASVNMKNITLETGGKSPLIVFEDADIEQAARWAYTGILSNQGQVCTATSRLLVHESVTEKFLKEFVTYVTENAKTGDPFSEDTTHGPQVSQIQYEKILGYVETAKKEGAKLELGGESAQKGLSNGKGFFIHPTIFTNVTKDMTIFREEIFGPVVAITPFKDDKEAIALANDSEYGLGAAVFSENIARAHKTAASLEAGMVWINSSNDSEIQVPFGGVKQSGIGRELGEAGLASYLETKAIHVNLGNKL